VAVSIPSAGALASADPSAAIGSLTKAMNDLGAKANSLAGDKVDGKDVYHVSVSVPVDKINALLAAQGGSSAAGIQLDSATSTIGLHGHRPAGQVRVKISARKIGNFDVVATLTGYNQAVTINAPAASEIGS